MTISDWLVIAAIIIAPILAVQIQKFIEYRAMKKERKTHIFKALMATRATPLSPLHVEALNMLDIEFYKNQKVINAWRILLDHFANYPKDPKAEDYTARLSSCAEKSNELLTDLLYEMSRSLGYNFDKVLLKRGCYIPKGHSDIELEQTAIRRGMVDLLWGKKSLPVNVVENKEDGSQSKESL